MLCKIHHMQSSDKRPLGSGDNVSYPAALAEGDGEVTARSRKGRCNLLSNVVGPQVISAPALRTHRLQEKLQYSRSRYSLNVKKTSFIGLFLRVEHSSDYIYLYRCTFIGLDCYFIPYSTNSL